MVSVYRNLSRTLRLPLHVSRARRRLAEFHSQPRSLDEVVDASLDLKTRGLVRIKARQRRSEIYALAHAVMELKPRNVLEIGTDLGGTLFIWSQLASGQVITCDLVNPPYRQRIYAMFPAPGSPCRVKSFVGNSHEPAFHERVRSEFAGEPVDFLFIDGDHSEAGVTADYESYRGLVREGGLIAFHDIVQSQPFPDTQVERLWRRLKQRGRSEEFIEDADQCGFGIGLLQV